jgi:hypothetical protein
MTAVPGLPSQCRWALDCTSAAAAVVTVATLRLSVPVCTVHAAEHAEWVARKAADAARGMVRITSNPEPEPECWCPDKLRRRSPAIRRREVPHCPRCGTEELRGLEVVVL